MNTLVAFDLSQTTEVFMSGVRQWARDVPADYWFLHVADPDPAFLGYEMGPQTVRDQVATKFHREHQQLQQLAGECRELGLSVTALLVQGATAETILHEAARLQVNLIIVGSHGHGPLHQMLVGSVSEAVLRKAPCPVLVIPTHRAS